MDRFERPRQGASFVPTESASATGHLKPHFMPDRECYTGSTENLLIGPPASVPAVLRGPECLLRR